jgi:hypothetical protein
MVWQEGDRIVTIEGKPGVIHEVVRRGTEVIYFVQLDEEEGGITDGPFLDEELRGP